MHNHELLASNSQVWNEAEKLLREQRRLHQDLISIMKDTTTGIYSGGEDADNKFIDFIQTVRKVLSRSPRTMLHQTINQTSFLVPKGLLQSLHLTDDATLRDVGEAMNALTEGTCYCRLKSIRKQQLSDPDEKFAESVRKKVQRSLLRKRRQVPTRTNDEEQILEQVVHGAMLKEKKRRQELKAEASHLEGQLENDAQYERFTQSKQIWQQCGGEGVWNNFRIVDRVISQSRGMRGSRFESKGSELVFAMIVLQLSGRIANGSIDSSYSYQQGVHWWHAGRAVGELDLVVYYDDQIVAVCEMKSSCFEIAVAPRQHEVKLKAAAIDPGDWTIGLSADEAISLNGREEVPLFLATLLPNQKYGEQQLGVEPLLVKAVCQGIRKQGKDIGEPSNLHLCRPLISILKSDSFLSEAIEYLDSIPPSPSCPRDLNYDQLKCFVLAVLKREQVESPLGFLTRFSPERVLVLPRAVDE